MAFDRILAKSIFIEAAELLDSQTRRECLDRRCDGNDELRAHVEALLRVNDASPLLQAETTDIAARLENPELPETNQYDESKVVAGFQIAGKYKLLQQIGEGGMGTVWMADQTEPVKRRVAVKLIRTDRGQSKSILARFEAERQAIALMDHPYISKLLDAGTSEIGAPYFVMELVKGVPVTEYCDAHKLSIPDRLRLFVKICSAVQHAHQKGIIHRDLKPSNILIESHDGTPVPKIIDFGLAKAVSGLQLTENTLFTGFGSVLGTPLYMAPEQASFNAIDVDTRADVYALGILLFELLTGTTPLTRESVRKAAMDEILRLIREMEAPSPSSRISSLDTKPTTAANRQTEPVRLGNIVKGELDWIVLKSLNNERDRRYETANGLANDIERFLANEPVQAGPPSAIYRMRKFVRRNRIQVIAACTVLLTMVTGIVGTTVGLFEANRQRTIAETNEKTAVAEKENAQRSEAAEILARQEEERQRKFAEAIAQFVRDDFLGLTSVEGQGRFAGEFGSVGLDKNATLMTLLDRAAAKLKDRKDLAPLIEAELNWIVGVNYRGSGEAAKGLPFLQRTVELRRSVLGPEHHSTLGGMNSLAVCYQSAGMLDEALPMSEETFTLTKTTFGPDHPQTANSIYNLAECFRALGRIDEALPLHEQALTIMQTAHGVDHPETIYFLSGLASGFMEAGRMAEALPLCEKALSLSKEKLGPENTGTLRVMNTLAESYRVVGRLKEALSMFEETFSLRKTLLGLDDPETLESMNNLAVAYHAAGRLDEAVQLLEQAFPLMKAKLGLDHHKTFHLMHNLAGCYFAIGRLAPAISLLEQAHALTRSKLGENHPDTLRTAGMLAAYYRELGQFEKALPLLEHTHTKMKSILGPEHPSTLNTMGNLALCYEVTGRLDEAIPLFVQALDVSKGTLGPEHPETIVQMENLAGGYSSSGRHDESISLLEQAFVLRKSLSGPDHPSTLRCMNNLATSYFVARRLEKSVPLFEELLLQREKSNGRDDPDTQIVVINLGMNYLDSGRVAGAIPLLEEGFASATNQDKLSWVGPRLLEAYAKFNKLAEARKLFKEILANAREQVPIDVSEMARCMTRFGRILSKEKEFVEAEALLRESLSLLEKHQPDGWYTYHTQSLLGWALLEQKEYADAEPNLVKGYEGMIAREKSIPPNGSNVIPEALDRLIAFYVTTNSQDKVNNYQKLRASYPAAKDAALEEKK